MFTFDIQLFGGRGASSNINSRMNFTLKKDTIIKNTKILSGTRVTGVVEIAGGKRRRKIDVIDRLVNKYGGDRKGWSKRRGSIKINGKNKEVHFYYHPKIGKVEFKFTKKGD